MKAMHLGLAAMTLTACSRAPEPLVLDAHIAGVYPLEDLDDDGVSDFLIRHWVDGSFGSEFGLTVFSAASARPIWSTRTSGRTSPVIVGDLLYNLNGYDVKALRLRDGTQVWEAESNSQSLVRCSEDTVRLSRILGEPVTVKLATGEPTAVDPASCEGRVENILEGAPWVLKSRDWDITHVQDGFPSLVVLECADALYMPGHQPDSTDGHFARLTRTDADTDPLRIQWSVGLMADGNGPTSDDAPWKVGCNDTTVWLSWVGRRHSLSYGLVAMDAATGERKWTSTMSFDSPLPTAEETAFTMTTYNGIVATENHVIVERPGLLFVHDRQTGAVVHLINTR